VQAFDPVQGHVEGPRRAGRGEPVAVDHKGFAGDLRRFRHFRQRGTVLGVDGAVIALQQSRAAKEPRAIPQSRQTHPVFGSRAQHVDEVFASLEFGAKATADNQQFQVVQRRHIQARIRADHQAQVADHFAVAPAKGA